LPWCYAFVAAPLLALEAGLVLLLVVGHRRREGLRLATAMLPYPTVWALRALAAAWAPGTLPSATRHVFRSSAPILTPSVAYGCLLLLGFAATALVARRPSMSFSGAAPLAPLCFALPVLLLNQQVATGFMFSTRDFERYGVYPFLVLGGGVLSAGLSVPAAARTFRPLALLASLLVAVVVLGQFRVVRAFSEANQASLAMARAARAAGDESPSRILLEEAAGAPLLATRLFDFRGAEGSRSATFVVDYTDISRLTLPRFGSSDPLERASAEFHEGRVFERFARLGYSPDAVRAVLEKEAAEIETGRTFFLHFLFPLSEVWYPLTDGRMTRKQAVLEALDGVVDRYAASLGAPPERWRESVLLITPHEPGEAPTGGRWRLEHLGTGNFESSRGRFVFHAYRQSWRGEDGAVPGAHADAGPRAPRKLSRENGSASAVSASRCVAAWRRSALGARRRCAASRCASRGRRPRLPRRPRSRPNPSAAPAPEPRRGNATARTPRACRTSPAPAPRTS